ncbi:MAG: ABC transporter ATP-binding protein/permease [Christensenellaceae bacterium]|jgi:ABC-type multidrug transport system fused ATPase/permease subunit|nr:ABC transporter ATP-binding protein/permease [Christensenellaceae bacterium]
MLKYLFKDKLRLITVILLNTIHTLLVTGLALIYGELVNTVAQGATTNELLQELGFALLYSLFTAFSEWARHYFSNLLYARMLMTMQNDMFAKLVNSNYDFLTKEDSSRYYDYMTGDLYRVRAALSSLVTITDRIVATISSFVAAVILNYKIALVMFAMTLIMALIPVFAKKSLIKTEMLISNINKVWARSTKENLQGMSIIKSFGAEKNAASEIKSVGSLVYKAHKSKSKLDSAINGIATIMQNVSMLALVGITCYFVVTKEVAIGAVLSIVQIGMSFYGGILGLATSLAFFWGTKGIRDRVWAIIGKKNVDKSVIDITFKNMIEFKNVSFAYDNDERLILSDINFKFKKDKKYLVLGKSGSGKSTILKLIANYYTSYQGCIKIDDVDYQSITDNRITEIVAIAQQNCYLFNRSMRHNIDYLQTEDDSRLNEIVNFVCLNEFISRLPDGIDTIVDEEVHQVSGGEKLRINLARALYKDNPVLLLDEVTSSLDKTTAGIVEANLLALKDKTIINVCHKFNEASLPLYDMILIIEDGKIVEYGSYSELTTSKKLDMYRNKAPSVQAQH